ncbi:ABC transporter ATP-binding protein [Pseudomonas sp. 28 E 9]|jgi:ABC-2 type transport system ATP-binding protein|uniref:ABC transporter ATP-binding protein n=1 Tax=Pseudomonas sp. 28 E 9 TaxID=1844098 RepID=UPI00081BE9EF|nr:ABC transporter ATP-binding protein [Pseudomonas sp. 28 E 9]
MLHEALLKPLIPSLKTTQSGYLTVSGLSQSYAKVEVLKDINFSLHPGDIVGLVGPNGAGKTTLIETILGLLPFAFGHITLLGVDVRKGLSTQVKQRIGVAPQSFTLPANLNVAEIVDMYQVVYKNARSAKQLIQQVGLTEQSKVRFGRLSGGQKRRLALALSLIGEPDVMFLDEPTGDIDPQGRRFIWDIILEQERQAQRAVLIATHQMEEVEALCNRVIILDKGLILEDDRPPALIAKYCPDHCINFITPAGLTDALLCAIPRVEIRTIAEDPYHCFVRLKTRNVSNDLLHVANLEKSHPGIIIQLQIAKSTLEDVFIQLTGKALRD